MRLKFTLILILLISFQAQSQKLTGIWRGYFSSANGLYRDGVREETYKYELQIDQKQDNAVKGVTFSYKTTLFYGKASVTGIYTMASKTLIIKETGLLELEIGDKSQPCLMTCYLDYSKIGKLEVLQGTFISTNVKDKGDCGSGKVYLEKVPVSDFKPEDFLVKKKNTDTTDKTAKVTPKNTLGSKPASPGPKPNSPQAIGLQKATQQPAKSINLPKTKPGAEGNLIPKKNAAKADQQVAPSNPALLPRSKDSIQFRPKEIPAVKSPLPRVLVERENNLVRTIQTDEENFQIDLYDNGTIDHDSISVFHNNKLVIKNGGLSYTPLTIKVKASREDPRHEFIMVAENLGEIPPNTALMVITAGKKRYEIFLTSTEERNAKVVIEFKPKD